jgi:Holliday junction resolvasome RuvABC endonuclease subunit
MIYAFDASTTKVGWCQMNLRGDVLRSGCFSPQGRRAEQRLPKIWQFAHNLLADAAQGSAVAIEEPRGYHANMNTNIVLGRAFGVVEAAAYFYNFPVVGVNPQSVKQSGVHKNALRVASQLAGHSVLGDEADAIGVGLAALAEIKESLLTDL